MKELVEKIIQNSKQSPTTQNPRQLYFREFDSALRLATNHIDDASFERHVNHMERFGKEAGVSDGEIAYRKKTLAWTLSKNAR